MKLAYLVLLQITFRKTTQYRPEMKNQDISRRNFLLKMSAASGVSLGMAGILTGCGGGGESETADLEPVAETPVVAEEVSCTDVSGLTESEASMRDALSYVDTSTEEGKTCANCALYTVAADGENCGGCTLLKGPIHPEGYCISWAVQTA